METINTDILDKVLSKKELRNLDRDIAKKILRKDFPYKKYKDAKKKSFNPRSSETKALIKELRRQLRTVHGVFYNDTLTEKKKMKVLEELPSTKVLKDVLSMHVSTKERIHEAPFLYKQIQDHYDGYNTICDIGCGYNPLFFVDDTFGTNIEDIYFTDIGDDDITFLSNIYDAYGESYIGKARNMINEEHQEEVYNDIQKYDVCFCFKLFDSLEYLERGITAKILPRLLTLMKKGVIASFSKRTVSGKNFIETERYWFKDILDSEEISYEVIETKNEEYFLIS